MDADDALTAITNKNTDVVERRVQASCTTAGLSSKDCTRLMGATLKSVGEEGEDIGSRLQEVGVCGSHSLTAWFVNSFIGQFQTLVR